MAKTRQVVRRRRSNTTSQAAIDRRMREIWIDGFGLLPTGASEIQVGKIRLSLRHLVDDDDYWDGLSKLAILNVGTRELIIALKSPK